MASPPPPQRWRWLPYRLPAVLLPLAYGTPRLIIDTDMSTDCDDVGALCIAHALQDAGEADIIAVVHNTGLPEGVGAVSSINNWYGRNDIPIGAFKGEFGRLLPGAYVADLAANFSGPVRNYSQVPDAVDVYREVLAAQPDRSVTIASIGFMTNLAALLSSLPDGRSPLNGVELVAAKVARVAWMGGKYPTSGSWHEWNFGGGNDANWSKPSPVSSAATSLAVKAMPDSVEVIFSGVEVGGDIFTGARLTECAPPESPCRQAYIDRQGPNTNRESWDPSVLLLGVFGVPAADYRRLGRGGRNVVDAATGSNVWLPDILPRADQSYVELLPRRNVSIADQIDDLLCRLPAARGGPGSTRQRWDVVV